MSSEIFNASEAAEFLGAHVETVRRLARRGRIPSFKVGKDWRFRKADLLHWAENHHLRNQPPVILVVDDEQPVRDLARQIFERQGFKVLEAGDGIDGLAALYRENVQLILLDLQMPSMNGVEFLSHLRRYDAHVPVILITGYPDSELIIEAMQQSPVMLLPKPIEKEMLLRVTGAVLSNNPKQENES
jgi:excisionase family DNA binding protein